MGMRDKQAQAAEALRTMMTTVLVPGERLVGAVHATQAKTFSADMFGVGVTDQRLIVVPLTKRMEPSGDPVHSITPGDITGSSIWGWEGSVRDFLSASSGSEIRVEAHGRKYKWMILGGTLLENALAGAEQVSGLGALVEFIRASKRG